MSEALVAFTCGKTPDHVCDTDGPIMVGGEREDGTFWSAVDSPDTRKGATWGSVSCSVCHRSEIERRGHDPQS